MWFPTQVRPPGFDEPAYSVAEQEATERVPLERDGWLLVFDDDGWIRFAVFEWLAEMDGVTCHSMLLHGEGPAGALRECRHIWWGEEGYTFMLNFKLVEQALAALRKWFD